jgi:hypothetical protein
LNTAYTVENLGQLEIVDADGFKYPEQTGILVALEAVEDPTLWLWTKRPWVGVPLGIHKRVLCLAVSRDTIKFTLGKVLKNPRRGLESHRRLKEQEGIRGNAKAQRR